MYPFRNDETFTRNSWYVGCSTSELGNGPIERTIMDRPVVFYRSEAGDVLAMHALCPHRAYPLAMRSKVCGDALQCAYHGMRFDGRTGACVHVPTQATPPAGYRQQVYPVQELGPWVWIWPGDPALADRSKIPSLDEVGLGDGWKHMEPINFLSIKARYMFLLENLFDLTHLAFLHGDKLDCEALIGAPIKIDETSDRITVLRPLESQWSNLHEFFFGAGNRFNGSSRSESETVYYCPGYITTTTHTMRSIDGLSSVDKKIYGDVVFHHAITPETRSSCHYFGTSSRTHRHADADFEEALRPLDVDVRQQDVDAVEAIEARMIQFGEPATELLVKSDRAAGMLRRRIQRAIDSEHSTITAPAGS